ncbi:hypothetical protein OIU79_030612 [Salix purpurea]|uniref:Uncharacterized protein n=1 Tax=Salix purpurea TaxID=77065 RepID=A0A9Q0ZRS0_SALPP|nr:hypothetical protein OIU79_030612 [Salix purpurea]
MELLEELLLEDWDWRLWVKTNHNEKVKGKQKLPQKHQLSANKDKDNESKSRWEIHLALAWKVSFLSAENTMEGVPPSFMEDYVNELEGAPSSPPEEVPVNQSSISCNNQAGQNLLVNINDTIQQTTRFPPSFPQTMVTTHVLFISFC